MFILTNLHKKIENVSKYFKDLCRCGYLLFYEEIFEESNSKRKNIDKIRKKACLHCALSFEKYDSQGDIFQWIIWLKVLNFDKLRYLRIFFSTRITAVTNLVVQVQSLSEKDVVAQDTLLTCGIKNEGWFYWCVLMRQFCTYKSFATFWNPNLLDPKFLLLLYLNLKSLCSQILILNPLLNDKKVPVAVDSAHLQMK